MKIYTVMPASIKMTDHDDATIFTSACFDPEVFDNKGDAVEAARLLARRYSGQQVWIVDGEVADAYSCEPLPVLVQKPTVQVMQ